MKKGMKKILWFLLEIFDNNWGYSTPRQKRFKSGDIVYVTQHKSEKCPFYVGEKLTILEEARHDYLVQNSTGIKKVVYAFEVEQ